MKSLKKFYFSFLFIMITGICVAQVEERVKWSFSAKKIDATTYELQLTAKIEKGWHIYSQTTPDGGPVPTSIEFSTNPLLTIEGEAKENGKLEKRFEELFGVEVKQFSDKVEFVQRVKLKNNAKTNISGSVKFMTCNDHECMPPSSQKFSVALK